MIYFLIPAFNEEENIPLLLNSIIQELKNTDQLYFMIINDGSTDDTKKIVESYKSTLNIECINHSVNLGPGRAFNSGYSKILKICDQNDIIISIEADNTSDISILKKMIEKLNSSYDIVLSSCYAKGGIIKGSNFHRILISKVANFLLSHIFNINNIHTYSSFYRGIKASTLQRLMYALDNDLITEDGFICMVEMIINSVMFPVEIIEIPCVLNCDLRKGNSKMKVLKTFFSYIRFISKEIFGFKNKNKLILKWDTYNNN